MRRFVFWGAVALAVTAFLAARPAAADEKKLGDDAKFLKEAISGGMLEVKLGELARDKGMDPDVKKFGERMVTDHSKANKELTDTSLRAGRLMASMFPTVNVLVNLLKPPTKQECQALGILKATTVTASAHSSSKRRSGPFGGLTSSPFGGASSRKGSGG